LAGQLAGRHFHSAGLVGLPPLPAAPRVLLRLALVAGLPEAAVLPALDRAAPPRAPAGAVRKTGGPVSFGARAPPSAAVPVGRGRGKRSRAGRSPAPSARSPGTRSEEHTSELQSP